MAWRDYLIFLGYLSCIITTWVEKSWNMWLYGNLTRDVVAFPIQICTLVQQMKWGAYYSSKVSSVLSKTDLAGVFPVTVPTLISTQNGRLYCACVVPRLVNKLINEAWLGTITSFFLDIYRVSSWKEWKRAGALHGNLTCDVLASLIQMCTLVQQTKWGAYYSSKVSLSVLSKTDLAGVFPVAVPTLVYTQNGRLLLRLCSATPR